MAEASFDQDGQPEARQYGSEFNASFVPPPPPPVAAYELRPLTTGEILDRTFYLYRGNFWLFTGISSITAAGVVLISAVQLLFVRYNLPQPGTAAVPASPFRGSSIGLLWFFVIVLYLVLYSVAQAATVSAVTSIYLGDSTSNKQAFRAVLPHWLRYLGIALWQAWGSMWIFFVAFIPLVAGGTLLGVLGAAGSPVLIGLFTFVAITGGFVYAVIAYIRNSLAVPVEVTEGLKVRGAMRRSKDLVAGTKGRIFLLFLLVLVLYIVSAAVQMPLAVVAMKAGPKAGMYLLQIILLFVKFIMTALITPVSAIGLCLFYIDQRVRNEGFDIEFLLSRSGPPPVEFPTVEAPVAEIP